MLQRIKGEHKFWAFGILKKMFDPKRNEVKGKEKIT
jgi:hypothetical protein